MARLFPGSNSVVFVHENDQLLPAYTGGGVLPEALTQDRFNVDFNNLDGNNALAALLTSQDGFIARSSRFIDPEIYRASRFYKELVEPFGYGQYMTIKLDSHDKRGAVIAFVISGDPVIEAATHDPLFETLKLLTPHIVRALHMSRALSMARNALSVMGGFLDTIALPLVVVTSRAEFVFANDAGRRLLDRGDLLTVAGDARVILSEGHETSELHAKLRDLERSPVAGGMRVEREEGAVSLCLTPFRPSRESVKPMDRDLFQNERLCALFVGQRDGDAINLSLLQDVYDLSAREAEVCGALISGESPAQIAERSDRSVKTVRNQIQAVYEKVGVQSNVELAEALSVFRTVGAVFRDVPEERRLG